MSSTHRRDFLSSSLGTLAGLSFADPLFAKDEPPPLPSLPTSSRPQLGPASLFLTWWTDPTTTMVIQWVGPGSLDKVVHYTSLDSVVWKQATVVTKPFPDTLLKVHRCELSGLTPDTEYKFCIGRERTPHRFRTMPAKGTNAIQFVSGGDCGTGKHAIESNIIAAKQEPHFTLIGGDLAYDNGRSPSTFLTFLENYSRHMIDPRGRMIPMLSCLGNHEVRSGYNGKRADAPHYLSVFDGIFRETSYGVLDFGDYLSLVLLDTGHLSPIKGAQTDWLKNTLSSRRERRHLIAANHVPAYPSFRPTFNTGDGNRELWCPLFEKYNVDAVLEHHDHTFKRTHPMKDGRIDKYGVLYLGDGSWGKLRPLHDPEERPYLAAWSEMNHVTVHRLEGDKRFHIALEASGKVADACATVGKRPAKRG